MREKKTIRMRMFLVMAVLFFILPAINSEAAQINVTESKSTEEKNNTLKKVRVGYLIYPGYQEGEGEAPKSGYGYEYLQQIAYYAGWEYEYVNGGFNELLEMLKKGKIDIMGNLSYTEERAQDINYAKEEQGREYYYLFVREDRTDISATDLTTLKDAKIGINKGSVQVDLFKKWCKGKMSAASASLDATDKEWLKKKKEIKVGYVDNTLPYSNYNKANGEMIGLLSTFINHMKERYNADFKPVKFESYKDMAQALQKEEIDTAFPIYGSYWIAEKNNLLVTGDLTSSYLMVAH